MKKSIKNASVVKISNNCFYLFVLYYVTAINLDSSPSTFRHLQILKVK